MMENEWLVKRRLREMSLRNIAEATPERRMSLIQHCYIAGWLTANDVRSIFGKDVLTQGSYAARARIFGIPDESTGG